MTAQVSRHFLCRSEQRWEQSLVCLDNRVARIEYEQRHSSGVGIYCGFYRVANVVCTFVESDHRKCLRVRMRERSCIAVHHPNQSAIVADDEVGVLVPVQETSQMFQSGLHVAIDHHAALSGVILLTSATTAPIPCV